MVYRKTRGAAMVLAVALGFVAHAAPSDPLAVVLTPETDHATDWSAVLPVRADLGGGRLLVEMDAGAWRVTNERRLPTQIVEAQGMPGEILYRVVGATAVERAMAPRMGRVLWSDGTQVLLAPAHEEDVWALGGDGVKLARVSSHAMIPATGSLTVPAAATSPDPAIADIVSKITGTDILAFDQDLVNFGTRYANLQGSVDAQNYL
ncbi:MAG TPA: hypothetical protein VMV18_08595, partial [bacterium]|nr:hypothetical protein [bacterium]